LVARQHNKEDPVNHPSEILIRLDRPDSIDGHRLIQELDQDLLERYPDQTIHGLRPQDVADPKLSFLVASIDGMAVGCGALRSLAPGVGEIKRMFVRPEFRGRGIARYLLAALESTARQCGYSTLRLETGTRQPEAIRLYKAAGYCEIPCFGEYVGNSFSICFEKRLA
jgi:GNAT superfamily N-acetyltransferase